MNRREVLAGFGSMAALNATLGARSHALPFMADSPGGAAPLPAKQDFSIPEGVTYLNSAYTHPIPTAGLEALRDYGDRPGPARSRFQTTAEKARGYQGRIRFID